MPDGHDSHAQGPCCLRLGLRQAPETHDEGVQRFVLPRTDFGTGADEKAVFLDAGVIVEQGPSAVLFGNPERERTKRFIATLKQEAEKEGGGQA
jgi:hypothetical protein